MVSVGHVFICAIAAALYWTGLGWPLAVRIFPEPPLRLALAPALGWALFSAASLPILLVIGFTTANLALVALAALIAALALRSRAGPAPMVSASAGPRIPAWLFVLTALAALAPAIAILPKTGSGGVMLAEAMFDHVKVAMIDDMARLGLPPGNPFFGEAGTDSRLAYYYLWHFTAACLAKLSGASGWEADLALTWFTAFASLSLMSGLAVWLGGRRAAALAVLLLSAAASFRPVLVAAFGPAAIDAIVSPVPVVEGWLEQATWVPQHLAGATSAILAALLIGRLDRLRGSIGVPALALAAAASFESSTWIGGVTFGAACLPLGLFVLGTAAPAARLLLIGRAGLSAVLALIVASPLLIDEYVATAARGLGSPIAFQPYEVFGSAVPAGIRRALDLPGYWLVLLPLHLPAIFLTGLCGLAGLAASAELPPDRRRTAILLGLVAATGFGIAWLFASIIANDDLGWRAMLPGVLALTILAAAILARWLEQPAPVYAMAALMLLALGLPAGIDLIERNIDGYETPEAARFASAPEMWAAVRREAGPDERVGNNPALFGDMVRWPVNISWGLLADRRSCYGGWEVARAYVAKPEWELNEIDHLFARSFAGDATPAEIGLLAQRYDCRVILVTPEDGAWVQDVFGGSGFYRLVEERPGRWRIYRRS